MNNSRNPELRGEPPDLGRRVKYVLRFFYYYGATFSRLSGLALRSRLSRLFPAGSTAHPRKRLTGIRWALMAPGMAIHLLGILVMRVLIPALTGFANRVKYIHSNIASRAVYAFAESCQDEHSALEALGVLNAQLAKRVARPYEKIAAIMLALKAKALDQARSYASELLDQYPDAYREHQQAGIWFFIGGHYADAERIWGTSAEIKARVIKEQGLDRLGIRILGQSWLLAIGHIAHIDIYLKQKILSGHESQRTVMPMPRVANVPNMTLLNCWNNHLEVRPAGWRSGLSPKENEILQDDFWSLRLGPGDTRMFSHAGAEVQARWEQRGYGPLLELPRDLEERGWSGLGSLGLPRGQWFVCLHVREAGFHKAWHDKHPGIRNADILTYLKAVQRIIDSGGWVIRVGDSTMVRLPSQKGLIDYAHAEIKSEALDVFLCAKARFFIGTNSGLGLVPPIFGVPCAMTNWAPIALPQWYGRDRFIPKTIYSAKLGRALSLTELLSSPAAWQQFQSYFDDAGLEVRDNTEDEIDELIAELLEETAGKDCLTAEDKLLVQGYNHLVVNNKSYVGARLGRAWLRRHAAELSGLAAESFSGVPSTAVCEVKSKESPKLEVS